MAAVAKNDLEARLAEALPWVLVQFACDLDLAWLVTQARIHNLQNRLGFLVSLARRCAGANPPPSSSERALGALVHELERSRLANEDTLCEGPLPPARRRWLMERRTPDAAHWNLLTDWRPEHVRHVT